MPTASARAKEQRAQRRTLANIASDWGTPCLQKGCCFRCFRCFFRSAVAVVPIAEAIEGLVVQLTCRDPTDDLLDQKRDENLALLSETGARDLWAPEVLLIERTNAAERQELLTCARAASKTSGLDMFTQLLYSEMRLLHSSDFSVKSHEATYVRHMRCEPTEPMRTLEKVKLAGGIIEIPHMKEETTDSADLGLASSLVESHSAATNEVTRWLLNGMTLHDEVKEGGPKFFDSVTEAAVVFDATVYAPRCLKLASQWLTRPPATGLPMPSTVGHC